jgi:hypothetical protein
MDVCLDSGNGVGYGNLGGNNRMYLFVALQLLCLVVVTGQWAEVLFSKV